MLNSMPPEAEVIPENSVPPASTPPVSPVLQAPVTEEDTPLSPEEALRLFQVNPIGFIQRVVDQRAEIHLHDLKEKAELTGALNVFRRNHPEVASFEPFILQEVAELIRTDDDGVIAPWPKLLEDALQNFQARFQTFIQENPDMIQNETAGTAAVPFMEGATPRQAPQSPAKFTRSQIAKMSLKEFLKNETAINEALKNNRIQ